MVKKLVEIALILIIVGAFLLTAPSGAKTSTPTNTSANFASTQPDKITLSSLGAVYAGQRESLTLQLWALPGTCSLAATSGGRTQAFPVAEVLRTQTQWTWKVPVEAKSATWILNVSCLQGETPTVSSSLMLRVRANSHSRGHRQRVLAKSTAILQSGAILSAISPPNSEGTGGTGIGDWNVADGNLETNWSGYSAQTRTDAQTVASVSGSWVVPSVVCTGNAEESSNEWVGIQGETETVQQTGTETGCEQGLPVYYPWYEMYGDISPAPAIDGGNAVRLGSQYPIAPGDVMTSTVSVAGDNWTLALADATQGWAFSVVFTDQSPWYLGDWQGEWVTENQPGCKCGLADFGVVTFSDASITIAGGTAEPINGKGLSDNYFAMGDSSQILAVPGPLDATGTAFGITWDALGPTNST